MPGDQLWPRGELHDEWRLSPDLHRAVADLIDCQGRVCRRTLSLYCMELHDARGAVIVDHQPDYGEEMQFLGMSSLFPMPVAIGWDGSTWHVERFDRRPQSISLLLTWSAPPPGLRYNLTT